jgi:hypothetical protein
METNSRWWRGGLVVAVLMCCAQLAEAQEPGRTSGAVESALTPGMTVWITDAAGREERSRITAVSNGIVASLTDGVERRFAATEIRRIQARESDSLLNGAAIGAAVAVGSGLFLCTRTEPWEVCRDDVGPILRIAAVGAGIGMAVDALIRGRRTIYEARPTARWRALPVVGRTSVGAQVLLSIR